MEDWRFYPASLNHLKLSTIYKHGIAGVHYAEGWSGLAEMLETYGSDHAPTLAAPGEGVEARDSCTSGTTSQLQQVTPASSINTTGSNNHSLLEQSEVEEEELALVGVLWRLELALQSRKSNYFT